MIRHTSLALFRLFLALGIAPAMMLANDKWGELYPVGGPTSFGIVITFFIIGCGAAAVFVGLGSIGQYLFRKRAPRFTALTDLGLFLAFTGALILGGASVKFTETQPGKYSSLLTEWTSMGLVAHFPKSNPATASNVRLSAVPGAWFQLRLTLPPSDVTQAYYSATTTAKDFYDGGGRFDSLNAKKGGLGLPGTDFHTAGKEDGELHGRFPSDYRIFVFGAHSGGGNPPYQVGDSYGVVISLVRNEVIYYADRWW